jgi:hypothetical protein
MLSLSEPRCGFRLWRSQPGEAFVARTATLGPVFFTGSFIIACLTFGDELLGLALQPATAGNAPQLEAPEIAFVSPEEAAVQTLLWSSLATAMPVAVLIAANLLTGRDPARALRGVLAGRLATAPRFCASEKGAGLELEAHAFEGTVGPRKFHHLAGLMNQAPRGPGLADQRDSPTGPRGVLAGPARTFFGLHHLLQSLSLAGGGRASGQDYEYADWRTQALRYNASEAFAPWQCADAGDFKSALENVEHLARISPGNRDLFNLIEDLRRKTKESEVQRQQRLSKANAM